MEMDQLNLHPGHGDVSPNEIPVSSTTSVPDINLTHSTEETSFLESSNTSATTHPPATELPEATIPASASASGGEESPRILLPTGKSALLRAQLGEDPRLRDPSMVGELVSDSLGGISHLQISGGDEQDTQAEASGSSNPLGPGLRTVLDQLLGSSRRPSQNPSYSPDIDDALAAWIFQQSHDRVSLRLRERWETAEILERHGFSSDGASSIHRKYTPQNFDEAFSNLLAQSDIEIFQLWMRFIPFSLTREFTSLSRNLNFAPSVTCRFHGTYLNGLARKVFTQRTGINTNSQNSKGKARSAEGSEFYHLWFYLPIVDFHTKEVADVDENDPIVQQILSDVGRFRIQLPHLNIQLSEDQVVFYLSYNRTSRKIILFSTAWTGSADRFTDMCRVGAELDLLGDPFAFISCALSQIIYNWSLYGRNNRNSLRTSENWILSLREEMSQEEVNKARDFMLELRKLRPFQQYTINSCESLSAVARDSIEEHNSAREFLGISESSFLRVDKNLRTIATWAESIRMDLKSDLERIDSCIATLSYLMSIKYDRNIDVNTNTMRRIAESAQDDNFIMRQIAKSTKLDSEAMKTIAFLTMLYLPATFVATFFSMGIFNFDSDPQGGVRISSHWWIYFLVTLPLTVGTYAAFRFAYKRE